MYINLNNKSYFLNEEDNILEKLISDIKEYCNAGIDNSIIENNIISEFKLISEYNKINKYDLYIEFYDDKIIIYNGSIFRTFIKNVNYHNCVSNFVDKVLKTKTENVEYYIQKMEKDNINRSTQLSYHKSTYFDKDLINLRHIRNECESIIKNINKLVENLTFTNYTE